MNKPTIGSIRSITAIFWLGFFMSISFMEAPLKFTAPNLSIAEGVQIGKIIFGVLNKCEWVFLLIILASFFFKNTSKRGAYLIIIVSTILIIETVWLLPLLNTMANKVISGQAVSSAWLHRAYILLEIIKIPVLLLIGWEGISNKETASQQE